MSKYRKKPVVVEARQFNGWQDGEGAQLALWCSGRYVPVGVSDSARDYGDDAEFRWDDGAQSDSGSYYVRSDAPDLIAIKTLEGTMRVSLGDYIIQGVQGEFYPCKPDIFEATYEAVTE